MFDGFIFFYDPIKLDDRKHPCTARTLLGVLTKYYYPNKKHKMWTFVSISYIITNSTRLITAPASPYSCPPPPPPQADTTTNSTHKFSSVQSGNEHLPRATTAPGTCPSPAASYTRRERKRRRQHGGPRTVAPPGSVVQQ